MNKIKNIAISGKKQSGKDTVIQILTILQYYKANNIDFNANQIAELLRHDFNSLEIASMSAESNIVNVKFAAIPKQIVCMLIGCSLNDLENEDFKNTELPEKFRRYQILTPAVQYVGGENIYINKEVLHPMLFTTEPEAREFASKVYSDFKIVSDIPTPRLLLQWVGTDFGRNMIHPNIWIYSALNAIPYAEINNKSVCITDCRFKNEFDVCKNNDFVTIRVNRTIENRHPREALEYRLTMNVKETAPIYEDNFLAFLASSQNEEHRKLFKVITHESETELDNCDNFTITLYNNSSLEDFVQSVIDIYDVLVV